MIRLLAAVAVGVVLASGIRVALAQDATLPATVKVAWDMSKAWRETTPTQERICINGLWRFRPADSYTEGVPAAGTGWGYFKVPGPWPQGKEQGQAIYGVEPWVEKCGSLDACWSSREITVPAEWNGRRIGLSLDDVNAYATVFLDGQEAGSVVFPGGELDMTQTCKPGKTHQLAIRVIAQRLNAEGTNYVSKEPKANNWTPCEWRGLCGDVYLVSTPKAEHITDVKVDTSVRNWKLTLDTGLAGLQEGKKYVLRAKVLDGDKEALSVESPSFTSAEVESGRFSFDKSWHAPKLWDTDTPQNTYRVTAELAEGDRTLDAYYPVRFGFREFWIEGRDFFLNGSPVRLSALPVNSAMRGCVAVRATYDGASTTFKRMQWLGFNLAYGHNYGCSPGSQVSYDEILRAADDTGMLFSFSLPQMRAYDWKTHDEKTNGYARDLEWYVRKAQNHPSVVLYAQNHNYLFCKDVENPARLGEVLDDQIPDQGRTKAVYEREKILKELDATRPVYNHGGWSPEMFTMNCYLNWVPMQERSEWIRNWAEKGTRPLFMVEYGEPTSLSFYALRDGNVVTALHQFFMEEWGAALRGDAAFNLTEFEKGVLRYEADRWRTNRPFPMWDYPDEMGRATDIPNFTGVQGEFIAHTWPYFRTWGLSGINVWSEWNFCHLKPGVTSGYQDYTVEWDNLQRPGISPDFYSPASAEELFYSMVTKQSDWVANPRGAALLRYNEPLLAYIAGTASRFTAQDHNFLPGATVEKQIILINDSRRAVDCKCRWSVDLPQAVNGEKTAHVEAGRQARIPIRIELPRAEQSASYKLTLKADFGNGQEQDDSFEINVLPPAGSPKVKDRIALFDPKGQTAAALKAMDVAVVPVEANTDLAPFDALIIGKGALTVDGPAPDLSRVPNGLKVLLFEQTSDALEKRLGFRTEEFGSRRMFKRVADSPVFAGLSDDSLRDWQGEATLVPSTLPLPKLHTYLTVQWCGFNERRPARWGNYGNVCSVMLEKPTAGDFMPLADCGFGLHYSPLLEYREGKGMLLFCQMDVTGRSQDDPAAAILRKNLLEYVCAWRSPVRRPVVYSGEQPGLDQLRNAGAGVTQYGAGKLPAGAILVIGPGGTRDLQEQSVADWLKAGGRILAVGLTREEAQLLPVKATMETREYIACVFGPAKEGSFMAGLDCGDVFDRAPAKMPLVTGQVNVVGDGVLAYGGNVVFMQLVPWRFDCQKLYNLKTSWQHSSFALNRLLANLGAEFKTPLPAHFAAAPDAGDKRWLDGLYLDVPLEKDDPYRYYGW